MLKNSIFGLNQWSPTIVAPGTDFMEYNLYTEMGHGMV